MSRTGYFVVMSFVKWENLKMENESLPLPVKVQSDGNYIGFLPVFSTREAAEEAYPGHNVFEARGIE